MKDVMKYNHNSYTKFNAESNFHTVNGKCKLKKSMLKKKKKKWRFEILFGAISPDAVHGIK